MTRENFLENNFVCAFVNWLVLKLDSDFVHVYVNRKTKKKWTCCSIYNAYEKYMWNQHDFETNNNYLERLEFELRNSIEQNNNEYCQNICLKILEWGGVLRGNRDRINNALNLVETLKQAQFKLSADVIENKQYYSGLYINSGFSKIYSLCVDDYAIYDSRVGTALGFLVREFCLDNNLDMVPSVLKFAYAKGRNLNVNRNPSFGNYKFPLLRLDNYIENNIKANWLLKKVLLYPSKFKRLPLSKQLRALDAALFMIGYEIPNLR